MFKLYMYTYRSRWQTVVEIDSVNDPTGVYQNSDHQNSDITATILIIYLKIIYQNSDIKLNRFLQVKEDMTEKIKQNK
jgi:hypothetical protein